MLYVNVRIVCGAPFCKKVNTVGYCKLPSFGLGVLFCGSWSGKLRILKSEQDFGITGFERLKNPKNRVHLLILKILCGQVARFGYAQRPFDPIRKDAINRVSTQQMPNNKKRPNKISGLQDLKD